MKELYTHYRNSQHFFNSSHKSMLTVPLKVISGLISPLNEPVDYQGIIDVNEEGQLLVLAGAFDLDILKW